MNDELEIEKSYTAKELLDFLWQNRRYGVYLASENNVDLSHILQQSKYYIVYKVQSVFLHRMKKNEETSNYDYQMNTDASKIYYIKPE